MERAQRFQGIGMLQLGLLTWKGLSDLRANGCCCSEIGLNNEIKRTDRTKDLAAPQPAKGLDILAV